jgi:dipeptidase E
LAWCHSLIAEFLVGQSQTLVFIPFAAVGFSYDNYTERVNEALSVHGIEVRGIHEFKDPVSAIEQASGILVGGGNTFHLLRELQKLELMDPIRSRIEQGAVYIGWSAGSNIAGKSICTTNDMPIVEPESFTGLSLFPAQINPHFTDQTIPNHGGESRIQRLMEFVEANQDEEVICLPEASYLRYEGGEWTYNGYSKGKQLSIANEIELFSGQKLEI